MASALHWRSHLSRIQSVLGHAPVGLITDIDGTLSPIAPTPEAATIHPACQLALQRLAKQMFIAAVSGRSAEDARRMVRVDGIIYIGNHGLDRLTPQGLAIAPEARRYAKAIRQLLRHAKATLDLPGMIVEDKGSTGSIHYRLCPDPEAARRAILDAVREQASQADLVLTQGRQVIEVRPPLPLNKGTAVCTLIRDYRLHGVFYLGDDTTDVDAFKALHAWRSPRPDTALTLSVNSPETPRQVLDASDLQLEGVEDVAAFLNWLGDHVRR